MQGPESFTKSPDSMSRILFLIRSLGVGGAERQLTVTAAGYAKRGHEVVVVTFYGGGALETELLEAGVRVINLNRSSRWSLVRFLRKLIDVLRRESPDIVYSFLSASNIFATLAKRFASGPIYVWGVRSSDQPANYPRFVRLSFWIEARLSRFAVLIIANSKCGAAVAVARGFPESKVRVVHNGIDTARFSPDSDLRKSVRNEFAASDGEILIGIVGRLHPIKGHEVFVSGMAQVASSHKNARFIVIGGGSQMLEQQLRNQSEACGISDRVVWSDFRPDMAAMYNALDIVVSTSHSEGFSNVLAESMACGTPCVASDVGDSKELIGGTGLVFPARDAEALSGAVQQLLGLPPEEFAKLGSQARDRIVAEYATEVMLDRTAELFQTTLRHQVNRSNSSCAE